MTRPHSKAALSLNGAVPTSALSPSDAELVRALADSDVSALGAIYDRYSDDVRRFALRMTGRKADADDVTHDTFVALVDAAPRYRPQTPLRSYLFGIASRRILGAKRNTANRFRLLRQLAAGWRRSDERTPEGPAVAKQQIDHYKDALARLTPAKRAVVLLTDVEDLPAREVAAALEIPIGTVWTRLHSGRKELRATLMAEGWL